MTIGPHRRALNRALRDVTVSKRDHAAVELCRAYADQLDALPELARIAQDIVEAWDDGDPIGRAHVGKVANALSARQSLAELGPKYLAALAALNLTTAARVAAAGPAEGGSGDRDDPQETALRALRSGARGRRAAAVDAAASPPDA